MHRHSFLQNHRWFFFGETILLLLITFYIKQAYMVVVLCALTFYSTYALLQKKRQNDIQQLSMYLQQMYQGNEEVDIREYCEGELSILKSDLYKITHVMKQQSELLKKDKQFLASSLSDISHQIKTPLTSMLVVSDLLRDELPEEKRNEFILLFQSQLKRVEWLVSSLLKMSKIDADAVTFHFHKVSLSHILEESMKPFLLSMELHQQSVSIEKDSSIEILADENWLVEAFSNIIKNCLEHSEQHQNLLIHMETSSLHTRVMIQDHGSGIDPQDLPFIFERFYKGKNASNDSVGIGLALTRSILIHHQATIQVSSVRNKGTTFTITFYK